MHGVSTIEADDALRFVAKPQGDSVTPSTFLHQQSFAPRAESPPGHIHGLVQLDVGVDGFLSLIPKVVCTRLAFQSQVSSFVDLSMGAAFG